MGNETDFYHVSAKQSHGPSLTLNRCRSVEATLEDFVKNVLEGASTGKVTVKNMGGV